MVDDHTNSSLVFLADDDENDSFLFKDAIKQVGRNLSLTTFKDGFELMNHLNDIKNVLPDFIFLDINMPYKNGFDCLTEIRSNKRLENLITIVYTTTSHIEDIQKALNMGGTLYFAKTSTFQELVNRLEKIFEMNWSDFNPECRMDKFVFLDDVAF
jgi:DNA-binding response OmpR family regulator